MQVYTHYENHQGGINNLQVSRVVIGYSTVKLFKSLDRTAHLKAEKYISKVTPRHSK
jgi:hypothetical protein